MSKQIISITKGDTSKILFLYVIIFVIVVIILWLVYNEKKSKKEGFVKEIKKAVNEIKGIDEQIKKIPQGLTKIGKDITETGKELTSGVKDVSKSTANVGKQIDEEMKKAVKKIQEEGDKVVGKIDNSFEKFFKEVEKTVKDIVNNKILSFFKAFGNGINKGIVQPLFDLFKALGEVFMLIFEILELIIKKIVTLPDCVPYYGTSAGLAAGKKFMPGWIYSILKFWSDLINNLISLFSPVLRLFGIDVDAWKRSIDRKCYKFPVKGKTRKMKTVMKNAGKKFARNFGRIKIKF